MKATTRSKGFTLIEIIAILVIIAIVAAVVVARGTSSDVAELKSRAETVRSHIRFTQIRAMDMKSAVTTCNAAFGLSITGNSYFMFRDCNKTLKVALPGEDQVDVPLPNMTLTNSDVTFNEWGAPCSDLTGQTPRIADTDLTLSYAGQTESIRITKNTGFVP